MSQNGKAMTIRTANSYTKKINKVKNKLTYH
jgi:hypothetical protein